MQCDIHMESHPNDLTHDVGPVIWNGWIYILEPRQCPLVCYDEFYLLSTVIWFPSLGLDSVDD
jgi:hypothetical protein